MKLCIEQLENKDMLSVVVGGINNITPPSDDPGFYNVGPRGSGSAVYLGNSWVLTAQHVGAGSVQFTENGVTHSYTAVPNSAVIITNSDNSPTDLVLYKINGLPNLPSVVIDTTAPKLGQSVDMIGWGRDYNPQLAYWTSSWQPSAVPATYAGYIWGATQNQRWGTNTISAVNQWDGVGQGIEQSFSTTFSNIPNNGQGAPGDSGGGVFTKTANGWQLAGIMFTITNQSGEPFGMSVFGQQTHIANLSAYATKINSIIGIKTVNVTVEAPNGAPLTNATIHLGTPTTAYTVVNTDNMGNVTIPVAPTGISYLNVSGYGPMPFNNAAVDTVMKLSVPSGDANHDGIVNGQDIALISSEWGMTGWNLSGDLNGDGVVNGQDIAIVSAQWLDIVAVAVTQAKSSRF